MDYQNRAGSKKGAGGIASASLANIQRKDRLSQLAMEVLDVSKDPYIVKLGPSRFQCKLCGTIHKDENSYLTHTQGKKHHQSLERRRALDSKRAPSNAKPGASSVAIRRFAKIGRPGYRITKVGSLAEGEKGLLVQVKYPQILKTIVPRYRFMSAFEQKIEKPDKTWQYLVLAAEPYDTIAIKIPAGAVNQSSLWTDFDRDSGTFNMQFMWPRKST